MGIDWRDRRLIGNLYMGQHSAANASKNRWRVLGTGEGGQRCETGMFAFTTIGLLFNIYIEELVREAVEDLEEGIKVVGRWIKALRFGDDQAMIAKSQKGLQTMMDRLDIKTIWNEDQHQKDKGIVKERKLYDQN